MMILKQRPLKKLSLLTLFLVMAFSSSQAVALSFSGTKVGYVNLNRLVKESKMGQKATESLTVLRQNKEADIREKIKEINAIKLELEAGVDDLKREDKKDKVDDLNVLVKEYKRMQADAKEEIERQDRDLVAEILKKADGILKNIAKKEGFGIILKDPKVVGYLDPDLDITDDVLRALNK
nr:OmpH family outer membrane protein [uncultured Desulfobacter sp.]